jgi:GNAT superfamily N-acetyltransferase
MEVFQREPATPELFEELLPLLVEHERAVSSCPDIPLKPDYDTYLGAEALGKLRVFTARDGETRQILGYSVFFVGPHIQKSQLVQAEEHALFVHPEARGFGPRFIDWTEAQIESEGAHFIARNSKAKPEQNFSPMLERKGYELRELVWMKRLGARNG